MATTLTNSAQCHYASCPCVSRLCWKSGKKPQLKRYSVSQSLIISTCTTQIYFEGSLTGEKRRFSTAWYTGIPVTDEEKKELEIDFRIQDISQVAVDQDDELPKGIKILAHQIKLHSNFKECSNQGTAKDGHVQPIWWEVEESHPQHGKRGVLRANQKEIDVVSISYFVLKKGSYRVAHDR